MTYYARDIRDVKEFENLDVREKLLREEENLHEMYNSSHHVNNKNGKENESHKNEDDITSETTGGGVVITDDILAASKKKGENVNSLDEQPISGISVSDDAKDSKRRLHRRLFRHRFRGGPFGSGGESW